MRSSMQFNSTQPHARAPQITPVLINHLSAIGNLNIINVREVLLLFFAFVFINMHLSILISLQNSSHSQHNRSQCGPNCASPFITLTQNVFNDHIFQISWTVFFPTQTQPPPKALCIYSPFCICVHTIVKTVKFGLKNLT